MRSAKPKQHDEFFKEVFSYPEVAKDYLKHFLPNSYREKFDLAQIEPVKGSFVSNDLKEFLTDVVYACPLKDLDSSAWITFLFEHKSYPVAYTHFQLLRYMLGIWEDQIKQKRKPSLVLPILIYHGEAPWPKQSMGDYFPGFDQSFSSHIPDFEYFLTDLKDLSDEFLAELNAGILTNALFALKHIWDESILITRIGLIFKGTEVILKEDWGRNFVRSMVVYIFGSMEITVSEAETITKIIPKEVNNVFMSTLEMMVEQRVEQRLKKRIEELDEVEQQLQQRVEQQLQQRVEQQLQQRVEQQLQQRVEQLAAENKRQLLEAALNEGLSITLMVKLTHLPEEKVREILDQIKKEKA